MSTYPAHCAAQIDDRIAGKVPAVAKPIFTTQNHLADPPVYVRNPDCWAADVDLSCISPWNSRSGVQRAGTLISPRHMIYAHHYPLGVGDTVRWVRMDNSCIDAVISAVYDLVDNGYPYSDMVVALLDREVTGCEPAKSLFPNWTDYFPAPGGFTMRARGVPLLATDQEEKALVMEALYLGDGSPSGEVYVATSSWRRPVLSADRAAFYEEAVSGDSGDSLFLMIEGQLVLVSHFVASTWGPSVICPQHRTAIETAMAVLGGGYDAMEDVEEYSFASSFSSSSSSPSSSLSSPSSSCSSLSSPSSSLSSSSSSSQSHPKPSGRSVCRRSQSLV